MAPWNGRRGIEKNTPYGKGGCFEPDASVMFKAFRPFHEACFSSMAALEVLAQGRLFSKGRKFPMARRITL
jgi:hypothetical protein